MKFNRDSLIELVHRHYRAYHKYGYAPNQLNHCSAWYSDIRYDEELDIDYSILQSYNTPVAVYIYDTNTVYRLGSWSRTTVQHQYKFMKEFRAQDMVTFEQGNLYRGWR